jgi:glucose-1-phosphate cytidylyltransferase
MQTTAEPWRVTLVDTGDRTQTGGRLKRVAKYLEPGKSFCFTYGDGVSDVDITALTAFHKAHGKQATLTAVTPPSRFGALTLEGDMVRKFAEKPQAGDGLINGGFFVLEPSVIDRIAGDAMSWESHPVESLARDGELRAFRHDGFWQSMDTLRDKVMLEGMWETGAAPWKVWT